MTTTVTTDQSGKTVPVHEINGRKYPGQFSLEYVKSAFHFPARPDDVLLCAYPKSGFHWIHQVIRYIQAGTTALPMEELDVRLLEIGSPEQLEDQPSPRHLNTHFHYENLSPSFLRQKCKMVYMTRDPRDVAVSYFNHISNRKPVPIYGGTWGNFLEMFMEGQVTYDSWFEHTKGWEKAMADNPHYPMLVLSYEAFKRDPLQESKRIAEFLNLDRTEDFLKEVVEKTNFRKMRSEREHLTNSLFFYRKGETGDWKNWFTVAQSERFNRLFEQEMAGTKAYKLYSHTV